ncbi:MAG TPA: hypothetical protein PLO51_05340 [Candidatus Micrarchaeota archaeon]|nr:hypothetical protein [Candidatus Micrarchaeota archaeon]
MANAKTGKKGQAALEFMSYMGFFMILFVITVLMFADQQTAEISNNKMMLAQETANQMADRINFVLNGGDGFAAKFEVPETILTQKYTMRIYGGNYTQVFLNWTEKDGRVQAVSAPINTGALKAGMGVSADALGTITLNASMGEFKVTNTNGNLTFYQPAAPYTLPPIDQ